MAVTFRSTGLLPDTKLLTRSDFSEGFSAVSTLAAPKSPSRFVEVVMSTFCAFPTSVSDGNSTSGGVSISEIAAQAHLFANI